MEEFTFYTQTMAKVYADQGNLKKAAKIYKYILKQYPDRIDIKNELFEIEAGLKKKKLEDLVPLLVKWIDLMLKYDKLQRLEKFQKKG